MIPNFTKEQLDLLDLNPSKPLVICDVDEVIVHFTRSFEQFLAARNLWLEPISLALAGNIRSTKNNISVSAETVNQLVDDFFAECTRNLHPIDGAVDALLEIGKHNSVVMLTNLPHFAKSDRTENLKDFGITYPVITNSGPKGPAIKHLAEQTSGPVIFVDDSPGFIQSANEYAPQVKLVHFLQDERFARHTPHFDFVSLRTHSWEIVKPHILELTSC